MSEKNLNEYLINTKPVLFVRRNIIYMSIGFFLMLNYGSTFKTLKAAISVIFFNRWGVDKSVDSTGAYSSEYYALYSIDNINLFSETIMNASIACVTWVFCIWAFDLIGDHRSHMSRETAQMRRRIKQEIKDLDAKGRIITTLDHEQRLNDIYKSVILRQETIISRHEHVARLMAPELAKIISPGTLDTQTDQARAHQSADNMAGVSKANSDDTFYDLFSEKPDLKPHQNPKKTIMNYIPRL